jgi:hypothetical protein
MDLADTKSSSRCGQSLEYSADVGMLPPMQRGASFNLDAVKAKIAAAQASIAK